MDDQYPGHTFVRDLGSVRATPALFLEAAAPGGRASWPTWGTACACASAAGTAAGAQAARRCAPPRPPPRTRPAAKWRLVCAPACGRSGHFGTAKLYKDDRTGELSAVKFLKRGDQVPMRFLCSSAWCYSQQPLPADCACHTQLVPCLPPVHVYYFRDAAFA